MKLGSSFTQVHTPLYQLPNFIPGNSHLNNCQPNQFHIDFQNMAHFTVVGSGGGACLRTGKEWLIDYKYIGNIDYK